MRTIKRCIFLLVVIMSFLFTTQSPASPTFVQFTLYDFSEFNEMRYIAHYGSQAQLHELLHASRRGSSLYQNGLTDRASLLEFVKTAGHARIPILSDSYEFDDVRWQIEFMRGESTAPHSFGQATIPFWFPDGMTVVFQSFYAGSPMLWGPRSIDEFESPTAVRNGVRYYQLLAEGWDDFIIFVDDYMLWARFVFPGAIILPGEMEFLDEYMINERIRLAQESVLSPEEKLDVIQLFSFVPLDETHVVINEGSNVRMLLMLVSLVSAAVLLFMVIRKRRSIYEMGN